MKKPKSSSVIKLLAPNAAWLTLCSSTTFPLSTLTTFSAIYVKPSQNPLKCSFQSDPLMSLSDTETKSTQSWILGKIFILNSETPRSWMPFKSSTQRRNLHMSSRPPFRQRRHSWSMLTLRPENERLSQAQKLKSTGRWRTTTSSPGDPTSLSDALATPISSSLPSRSMEVSSLFKQKELSSLSSSLLTLWSERVGL